MPEINFVIRIALALLKHPDSLAYFNPNGEILADEKLLRKSLEYHEQHQLPPFDIWVNVRVLNPNNGWMIMDTVGMEQLDRPDLEACFPSKAYDLGQVSYFLRNCCFEHSLALKDDGILVAWGSSGYVANLPSYPLNPVAIATGDFLSLAISPVNLPPIAFPAHATGLTNQDLVLSMAGWDPNGDTLKFRNVSLPLNGTLYQFTSGGRGTPITDSNTIISDSSIPSFSGACIRRHWSMLILTCSTTVCGSSQ